MSHVDTADHLATMIARSFTHWPATMNPCPRCAEAAYGRSLCPQCLTIELAVIVGQDLALEMLNAAKSMGELRAKIVDTARSKQ